jgi:hypothetical protein
MYSDCIFLERYDKMEQHKNVKCHKNDPCAWKGNWEKAWKAGR